MKKSAIMTLGAMLVAGSALASNTGFKLNYPLQSFPGGNSNTNWMSLPLFYFPNGNVSVTQQNAIDLCADLNDFSTANPRPKVAQVVKWLVQQQAPTGQACIATKLAFNLIPGEAYAAVPATTGIVVNVVGSNNDAYAPNKGGTSTYPLQFFTGGNSNTNWVSVPYHTTSDNAIDLCEMYNGTRAPTPPTKVAQVVKWLVQSQAPQGQSCLATKLAFNLVPGEGYAAVPAAASQTVAWNVY